MSRQHRHPHRIGAISCLGYLPLDSAAAAAVPYLEDNDSVDVRRQTLVSFAQRPGLLGEDQLLRRLHDQDPAFATPPLLSSRHAD